MKDKITSQKGFAASDALIAVLIIALFAGLIATISYNIYLSNSSIKRMSKATSYIVDMFEYIDKTYYDDVTVDNLTNYFNKKYYYEEDSSIPREDAEVKIKEQQEEVINTPFQAELSVVKYNEQEGNEDKIDLVQEITMKVSYKLGNKNQEIEMKKIKQRENLETPNKPDLSLVELQEGEKVYPIKNANEGWVVCDSKDTSWYNYESGNWAILLKTDKDLTVGEQVDIDNISAEEATYAWIPRFAYDEANAKIVFLFSNSNKFVEAEEGYNILTPIDEVSYKIPEDFESGEVQLEGIWVENDETDAYKFLDNVYELKR